MLSTPSLLRVFLLLHFVDNLICKGMAQVVMPTNKNKGFSALLPHPCASSTKCPLIAPLGPILCHTMFIVKQSTMRHYTKAQVLEQFRYNWKVATMSNPNLKGDVVAKREDWNNFTDMLCKCGEISMNQYNNWTNPF